MTTHHSFCRNCAHTCGLRLEVEDNKISDMEPVKDHALSQGYVCIKAGMSVEFANGGDGRLTQSLARQNDGSFSPVDNETAMDEIAGRLQSIIDQYGPRAVAIYIGTGAPFNSLAVPVAKAFLGELGSPNWASSMTVDQSAIWVAMSRIGFMASGKPLPAEVDTLFLSGINPIISHSLPGTYRPRQALKEIRERGGKIIVLDPRESETARLADLHLAIKPGQDAAFFAGMIRLILAENWHDKAFCDTSVEGVPELREAVEPFNPTMVAERTGISEDALAEAARAFATVPKSLAIGGTGTTMGPNSNVSYHLMECLNVICGSHKRAGDKVNQRVLFKDPENERVYPPYRGWDHGPRCQSVDAGYIFGELPTGALPDEILTESEHQIKALICWAGNPIKALGQPEKTIKAFESLDLLVSVDPRMNEVSELSDYVIAPTLPYERHDLTVIQEKMGMSKPFVQLATPVLTPPEGTLSDTNFFWGVAKRLGLTLTYKKLSLGQPYESARGGQPMDMNTPPEELHLVERWCEGTAVDVETLLAHPNGLVLEGEDKFVSAPTADKPGGKLHVCPPDVADELNVALVREEKRDYRYRLTVRRLIETMNSGYQNTDVNEKRYPSNFAYMHPDDMAVENLDDGESICLQGVHGSLDAVVKRDKHMGRGVISMSHMWGRALADLKDRRGSFTGKLVSLEQDIELVNRMPQQTAIPVNVSRQAG